MQRQTTQQIFADFNAHITKSGIPLSRWYAGITGDPYQRIHVHHKVPTAGHWFIYRLAMNDADARAIESNCHKAGCKGSHGGGDETAEYVYLYVITPQTVQ